jgi:hypothetical protein
MKLWTWHSSDFSLTQGLVDHARSSFFQTVLGVPSAYQELWLRLGTCQIIWCYTNREERHKTGVPQCEWALEVPDDRILRIVDGIVWNHIIGAKNCPGPSIDENEWKAEAHRLHPHDKDLRESFCANRRKAYWNQPPPPEGWWSRLFVSDISGECRWALIRHPVPTAWIQGCSPDGARK